MKPIEFKEQNVIFAKDQPGYEPLPAYRDNGTEGYVISCWKLSFIERMRILFNGVIWLNLMSFNRPLTPTFITTKKSEVLQTSKRWWITNILK
jgi:hypothetical protein